MASAKAKMGTQIGSAQWIQNEREQAEQFVNLEVEEFGYSVRNEFEWLNEHMAEIFSKQQLYVGTGRLTVSTKSVQQPHRCVQDTWQATRQDTTYSSEEGRKRCKSGMLRLYSVLDEHALTWTATH